MLRTPNSKLFLFSLVAAGFITAAVIADAVKTNSLGPIWMVGWLPAVLLAVVFQRPSGPRCSARIRRRARL
jgi:hypothetical protein